MRFFSLAALFLMTLSLPALAEREDTALIRNSVMGYSGNAMVNQAAGTEHQQANVRVIATTGASSARVLQRQDALIAPDRLDARARIQGAAFSNGSGVLGVNQGSGVGNQQINALRMVVEAFPESLDDSSLAQHAAPSSSISAAMPDNGDRLVEIDDRAFSGSRGVVQLNQSAGVGNRTANHLVIRVTP